MVNDKHFVLDLTKKFNKQLMKFDNSIEKLINFYKSFGYDKVPYDGIKRWGLDSSTDSSDITYDDVEVGHLMYWRKYSENKFRWVKIKITHKINGIIFFETIGEKRIKNRILIQGQMTLRGMVTINQDTPYPNTPFTLWKL